MLGKKIQVGKKPRLKTILSRFSTLGDWVPVNLSVLHAKNELSPLIFLFVSTLGRGVYLHKQSLLPSSLLQLDENYCFLNFSTHNSFHPRKFYTILSI